MNPIDYSILMSGPLYNFSYEWDFNTGGLDAKLQPYLTRMVCSGIGGDASVQQAIQVFVNFSEVNGTEPVIDVASNPVAAIVVNGVYVFASDRQAFNGRVAIQPGKRYIFEVYTAFYDSAVVMNIMSPTLSWRVEFL